MKKLLIILLLLMPSAVLARTTTQDPVTCMAQAIYYEAGGENSLGQLAVAFTVLNRLKAGGTYGSGVCGVVYFKCQYSWTCQKRMPFDITKHEDIEMLARRVLLGFFQDPTGGSVNFNNKPFKSRYMEFVLKIGNHYFYRSTEMVTKKSHRRIPS